MSICWTFLFALQTFIYQITHIRLKNLLPLRKSFTFKFQYTKSINHTDTKDISLNFQLFSQTTFFSNTLYWLKLPSIVKVLNNFLKAYISPPICTSCSRKCKLFLSLYAQLHTRLFQKFELKLFFLFILWTSSSLFIISTVSSNISAKLKGISYTSDLPEINFISLVFIQQ